VRITSELIFMLYCSFKLLFIKKEEEEEERKIERKIA
jgi:hypothetical protein